LIWLVPTLHYPGFADGAASPYQKAVDISIIWNEALGRITQDARGSRVNMVLWLAALVPLSLRLKPSSIRLSAIMIILSACLIVVAAVGAVLPVIATLQPNRFSSAAYLYLCVPAGLGVSALVEHFSLRHRLWTTAGAAVLAASAGWLGRELARELSYAQVPHHGVVPPEVHGIGPTSALIIDWLRTHTNADARILFETSKGRIHDNAHMAGYYALMLNREFIGGPYPYMHFAGYWDGFVFGRPIHSFSPSDFTEHLSRYNIGWILAFSETSKRSLERMPGIVPLDRLGNVQTYAVTGAHSFFLEGSGKIAARSINRLELEQLSGPSVVLKYHYVPGLGSTPPARLGPAKVGDDPIPFIRVISPPPHLVLQMK
jgi:hypothetical protein